MQVCVIQAYSNRKVKRPYVVLTLGDKVYQTTACSDQQNFTWNEAFDFKIPYHTQLFGVLQVDVYDKSPVFFLSDTHIGRAEIKVGLLLDLPSPFSR